MPVRQLPKPLRDEIEFMREHLFDPPESEVGKMLAERLGRKEGDDKPWSDLEVLGLVLVETVLEQAAREAKPNRALRRAQKKAAKR